MALTIGLTGGIASGKSTVSHMLKEFGIPVVDADLIAREVVRVGEEAYKQIVKEFGSEILQENGEINRTKLGSIVFHHEEKRKRLNAIVHPAVRKKMLEQKETFLRNGANAVVLDIPLLIESQLFHLVDKMIVVYVDEAIQLERLIKRNGLAKEDAVARIRAQMPLSDKKSYADAVIDNNGTIERTREQLLYILKMWNVL
ncbi:dephospho-CoA kinase [Anoxybacillus sp. B7M1]|uniref:dephospho-CoA kinase n=1 Tax=unclassified Anoxybacillus TaxID=2639704 RepID=UPI0005CD87CA|nr:MULTISPECIES: dephospho-CoA kinase [unclassified Anoxybacillus]ANB56051.1 dephospho-CoA kinase [Anoxybacillus sp. B2M1]ANB63357.1 dephospho-CoA kinase [Anoxybacillus sp. B7M1]